MFALEKLPWIFLGHYFIVGSTWSVALNELLKDQRLRIFLNKALFAHRSFSYQLAFYLDHGLICKLFWESLRGTYIF